VITFWSCLGVFSQIFDCFVLLPLCVVVGVSFAFTIFIFVVIVLPCCVGAVGVVGLALLVGLLWGCCGLYFDVKCLGVALTCTLC